MGFHFNQQVVDLTWVPVTTVGFSNLASISIRTYNTGVLIIMQVESDLTREKFSY